MSKLDGYKKGDEVEVTFKGVVDYVSTNEGLRIHSDADFIWIGSKSNKSDDHFQITRIEPAFKVGDRVKAAGVYDASTIVAFLSDGRVVCEYEAGETTGVCARHPSVLTHA